MNTQNSHIVINWEGYRQWHFTNGNAWPIPEDKGNLSILERPRMIEGQMMWRIGVGNITMAIPDQFVGFKVEFSKGVSWQNFNVATGNINDLNLFSLTNADIDKAIKECDSNIKMFKGIRAGSDLSEARDSFLVDHINAAIDVWDKLEQIQSLLKAHNQLVATGYLFQSGTTALKDFNPVTGDYHEVDLNSFTLDEITVLIQSYQYFKNSGSSAGSNAAPGAAGLNTSFFNTFSQHMDKALHNLHDLCEKKMLSLGMTI